MKKKVIKPQTKIASKTGDVVMGGKVIGKLNAPYTKSVLKPERND